MIWRLSSMNCAVPDCYTEEKKKKIGIMLHVALSNIHAVHLICHGSFIYLIIDVSMCA